MIKKITATMMASVCMLCSAVTSHAADNTLLTLDYTDSKQLITSTDDLFSNIGTLMPGDVVSDTLSIANKNSNTVELFFKSIPLSEDNYELQEDNDLLNKINLKIEYANKTLYDGALIGTDLSDIISLGKIKSGESGNFKFTITVPGDLTNEFNMTQTKVKWYFSVTEDAISVLSDTSPHTGSAALFNIGLLLTSTAAIIAFISFGRKDDNHEN